MALRAAEPAARPPRGRSALPYVLITVLLAQACGGDDADRPATGAEIVARDRAAEFFSVQQWADARSELVPLVAGSDARAEDLIRAGNVELAADDLGAAKSFFDRAADHEPEHPGVLWGRYRLAYLEGDFEAALELVRRAHANTPSDYPTHVAYAGMLDDTDRVEEALLEYEKLLAVPDEYAGSWKQTPRYRYSRLLMESGREAEGGPVLEDFKRMEELGISAPGTEELNQGTFGKLEPQVPEGFVLPVPTEEELRGELTAISDEETRGILLVQSGWGETLADLGRERATNAEELFRWKPETPRLVAFGANGLDLWTRSGEAWSFHRLVDDEVLDAITLDRRNVGAQPSGEQGAESADTDLDLIVVRPHAETGSGFGLYLLENRGSEWNLEPTPLFTSAAAFVAESLLAVDYDHDGDVDLVCSDEGGVRLLRNDGFDSDAGSLTVVGEALALGAWTTESEDVDGDNDVDLLLVPARSGERFLPRAALRPTLADNERGGVLQLHPERLPEGLVGAEVVAADFDGNGRVDLAGLGETEVALFLQTELGAWAPARRFALEARPRGPGRAVDWDQDGALDLLWPSETCFAHALLAPGFEAGGALMTLGPDFEAPRPEAAELCVAASGGDRYLELFLGDRSGVWRFTPAVSVGATSALVGLRGHKDNTRAIGAIIEAREGLTYQRLYYRGEPLVLGLGGGADPIDVVRITWPNGVVQSVLDLPRGESFLLWQRRGLVGSCPFLYTWNGETYEFITDVIGITPLGLPMGPDRIVPPDHDEYVLVRGEKLVPREGAYELQFTEELREVCYLDRIRLDVVDHPADVEVFPNERFAFPPFPEAHTHTVRDPLGPTTARGSDGQDWTGELAADDRSLAAPFEPLRGQYQGLAEPWFLELAFDPERVRRAEKLRLVMNGWLFWTDASVNMASARHPEHAFVPPLLQVPDGEGGWRNAGPPLGFPAGKLKTMVCDVTELVNRADPRIRVVTTLRLYWDSIRLAVDPDDAPHVVTALEPTSAVAWERGFSEPLTLHGALELEWFEWDRLAAEPRWNQHPGLYTRYGESVDLLGAIDDRLVILGAGDALTVRFPAEGLPPLPAGWRRDFLVFFDGWAKDRDPNTHAALFVEPLPFHGMSAYPYTPEESFPDDAEHRAWRRDWLTRPAKRWIPALAPERSRPGSASAGRLATAFRHEVETGE